jgi:tetratricopeptide (TPR) repeat protein
MMTVDRIHTVDPFRLLPVLLFGAALMLAACGQSDAGGAQAQDSTDAVANTSVAAVKTDPIPVAPAKAEYPFQVNADLARVYLKYNIIDEALRLFDLAITQQRKQTGTEDAENWVGLGDALVKANQLEKGKLAYERALAIYRELLKKQNTDQIHNYYIQRCATLCQALGHDDERTQHLAQLKVNENDADQVLALARVLEQVGQKQQAEARYTQAIQLSAGDNEKLANALVSFGAMLLEQNRLDDALLNAKSADGLTGVAVETRKLIRRLLFEVYEARGDTEKMKFE